MRHSTQRRVRSRKSASSLVLPATYQDMQVDAPSRSRRRRSTTNKIAYSDVWKTIVVVIILLSILYFGIKSKSALNYVDQEVQADSFIQLDSPHDVSSHSQQTSLPLSRFSDLTFALENSDLVALYFAASWCPMSTPVSLLLDTTFGENDTLLYTDGTKKSLAIVYVSSDKTIDEFNTYIHNRNWIAVPYESPQRNLLKRHFSTCAQRELVELGIDRMHEIPTIIVIDSATHGIITFNGVKDLESLQEESLNHWNDLRGWIRTAKVKR